MGEKHGTNTPVIKGTTTQLMGPTPLPDKIVRYVMMEKETTNEEKRHAQPATTQRTTYISRRSLLTRKNRIAKFASTIKLPTRIKMLARNAQREKNSSKTALISLQMIQPN